MVFDAVQFVFPIAVGAPTSLKQEAMQQHGAAAIRRTDGLEYVDDFDRRDSLEPVSCTELVQRSRAVTILDVRPEDEFALGHLPGALNFPLRELEARLGEIDPKQEVVAYCRGPYCLLSYEAVAALRADGFKAHRLEDGLPEWRVAGLPVVTTGP